MEDEKEDEFKPEKMSPEWIFADLHIHSRFSRACSKDLNIPNLVKWARVKGIGLLGTGDFTHPLWLAEFKATLVESEPGLYRLKPKLFFSEN
jgi:PHP family Zn ribbon phosphoesterase